MPRQTFNWSLVKSEMRRDRAPAPALTLNWVKTLDSFDTPFWRGFDADGASQGYVVINRVGGFTAGIYAGTDLQPIGTFPGNNFGLKNAQAAVEAAVLGQQVAA
jgi:hypothetical protein